MAQVTSSLLYPCGSIHTPDTEPLPLYTPRVHHPVDPETASIISAAPAYRSEAPTYTPTISEPMVPDTGATARGLLYRQYAPGFHSRVHGSVGNVESHNNNIANWSAVRSGPTSRHYENVARRRAKRDASMTEILNSLAAVPAASTDLVSPTTSTACTASSLSTVRSVPAIPTPYFPSEDSDLVGEAAATTAQNQRLYREGCLRDSREALKSESEGWDFMVAQMQDWEKRKQRWNNFRKDTDGGRRGKLARRIGFWKVTV